MQILVVQNFYSTQIKVLSIDSVADQKNTRVYINDLEKIFAPFRCAISEKGANIHKLLVAVQ